MASKKQIWPLLLSLLFLVTPGSGQDEEVLDLEKYVVRLQALGRTARLGSLYNASTETFSEISILNAPLPDEMISKTGTPSTNTKLGVMNSHSDKSSLLDVDASLQLSVLSGLVEVKGSAKYLHDEKKKSNSVVGALTYETLTYEEVLEIFFDSMLTYISPAVLNQTTESHVVIGIGWGSNVVIKFEDSNENSSDISEIQAKMGVNIQALNFGISSDAAVEVDESVLEGFSSYSLQIFGDFNFDARDYPTNVNQVIGLIEKIPELVSKSNEGKGKQLFFYLLPMERVREFMSYDRNYTEPPVEIPPEDIAANIQLFEETQIVRLKLNDLITNMMSNRDILNNTDLHKMHHLRDEFNNATLTYKSELRRGLVEVRTRKIQNINFFNELHRRFKEEDESALEKTENQIDNDFRDARLKVHLVEFLRSEGAIWVGRSDAVDTSIIKLFKQKGVDVSICSIHFYNIYLRNTILFVNAVLEAVESGFIPLVVDCDFTHGTCDSLVSQNKTCSPLYIPPTSTFGNGGNSASNFEFGFQLGQIREDNEEIRKNVQQLDAQVQKIQSVPIGFIYTELPGHAKPVDLWPQFKWTDISASFAGKFFRVVGGNASEFGATQAPSSGGLRGVTTYKCAMGSLLCSVYTSVELSDENAAENYPTKNTAKVPIGGLSGSTVFVDFQVSMEETRPINKAIRLWERTA